MAVVKQVLNVVQEWLGDTSHPPQYDGKRTIESARMHARLTGQMMRQMYL